MRIHFFTLTLLLALTLSLTGEAAAELKVFHNFQIDVPETWTVVSETIDPDQQGTLVKLTSHDKEVSLAINMTITVASGAEEVKRLVALYGGEKIFKPFPKCGTGGYRQKNPGGGWMGLCPVGENQVMSIVLDGRENSAVRRMVASVDVLGAAPKSGDSKTETEPLERPEKKSPKRSSGK